MYVEQKHKITFLFDNVLLHIYSSEPRFFKAVQKTVLTRGRGTWINGLVVIKIQDQSQSSVHAKCVNIRNNKNELRMNTTRPYI